MDTDTYPDGSLKEILEKFVLVKIDVDKGAEDIKKIGEMTKKDVSGIPDARILTPDGKQIDQVVGFVSPEKMKKTLEKALEKVKK